MSTTRCYEILFILDPALDDAGLAEKTDKVPAIIKDGGGVVVKIDKWGRRELAYEIDKKRMGYYVLIEFQGTKSILDELDRILKLDESYLRHMVSRTAETVERTPEGGVGVAAGDVEPVSEKSGEGDSAPAAEADESV